MKIEYNKKYSTISVYCILTFGVCLAMVIVCICFPTIKGYISDFFGVIAPVTWGIVIAYICNPIMKVLEKYAGKIFCKKKPHPKLCRYLSLFISLLLLIAVLIALVTVVFIQVRDSLMEIFYNIPAYISNIEAFVRKWLGDYPEVVEYLDDQMETIQTKLIEFANNIIPKLGQLSIKLKDGAVDFVLAIKDFVIGFIVAVYLLADKEKFLAQSRKMVCALFPKRGAGIILRVCSRTNTMLSGFISGKLLDSLIIGCFCFIGMRIFRMDFAVLISVIIGVTNIIPFFGPFIGAIPSAFLLLIAAPRQVIPFVIFIFALQQFDGNILGPKILGESTGLSPFWVMFAIFVGGGLFGFAGMILGVPLFAVLYELIREFTSYLLKRKKLSDRTSDYRELDPNDLPGVAAKTPVPEAAGVTDTPAPETTETSENKPE